MKTLHLMILHIFCFASHCMAQNIDGYKFIDNDNIVSEFVSKNTYAKVKSSTNTHFILSRKFDQKLGCMTVTLKGKYCKFNFIKINDDYILQEADISSNQHIFLKNFRILNTKQYILSKINIKSAPNNITFLASEGTESLSFFFKKDLLIRVGYISRPIE